MNLRSLQDKYQQLRIQQRTLDKTISDWESFKNNPQIRKKKLAELYRERDRLRQEISKNLQAQNKAR